MGYASDKGRADELTATTPATRTLRPSFPTTATTRAGPQGTAIYRRGSGAFQALLPTEIQRISERMLGDDVALTLGAADITILVLEERRYEKNVFMYIADATKYDW